MSPGPEAEPLSLSVQEPKTKRTTIVLLFKLIDPILESGCVRTSQTKGCPKTGM